MDIKVIYEDNDVMVVDKPAGIIVFNETENTPLFHSSEKAVPNILVATALIDELIKKYPELKNAGEAPRYGVVHRLDKDTSGILLVAKNTFALNFFQKQFSRQALEKTLEKRYIALVAGNIKEDTGIIHNLIARSKGNYKKQTVYEIGNPKAPKSSREAITEYKVLKRYQDYTLLEVEIKTGRKHQIRCHFAFIHHPIAGDKLYSFKDSPCPKELKRQFLHATYLKIQLPTGEVKEFQSNLPEELNKIIKNL